MKKEEKDPTCKDCKSFTNKPGYCKLLKEYKKRKNIICVEFDRRST
jgi:hypothetical protein